MSIIPAFALLVYTFSPSNMMEYRTMPINKNQDVLKYSGKASIVRIDIVNEAALHVKPIVKAFETSVLLFKPSECFAFQCADDLRSQLPHRLTPFTHISETKYKSWIVYSNRDNERMVLYDTVDYRGTFRIFENLIKHSKRIPAVKVQDLYKDITADGISNRTGMKSFKLCETQVTKDQSERDWKKPVSVGKTKLIRNKLRQFSFPSRKPDLEFYPLEGDYPIKEHGSRDVSEQAVSGQLTRSERRQRPDNNSAWYTGVHEYTLSIGNSHSIFNQADTSTPPKYPEYSDYPKRKESFSGYPRSSPSVTAFCNAGLFFTKQDDLVRCFQCGIGLKDFSADDDPLLEHVRFSENCVFLNKSLDPEFIQRTKARSRQSNNVPFHRDLQLDDMPSSNFASYRHPEYLRIEARLATFDRWPSTHGQSPQQLAAAGLFYTGYDDLVRCFSCDGGLRRWEPEDDPWTEHCRWFPTCKYARETKGDEFIALVQAMVLFEEEGAGASGGQSVDSAMQKLSLTSPQVKAVLDEHRTTVVENMGFDEKDFKDAVMELKMRDANTLVEDIVELIEIIQDRKRKEKDKTEEENQLEINKRLKRFLICTICKKNEADALFLPCAHHNTCMNCAKPLSVCPACNRTIKEKLKTYLG